MNERIKIVTDSTSDIPREIIEKYDIAVLPTHVIMNKRDLHDNEVPIEEIYSLIKHAKTKRELPITYSTPAKEIESIYEGIRNAGYTHILSIHISAKLSRLYQNALAAVKNVPGIAISVVDSKFASIALGLIVVSTARDIAAGMTFAALQENIARYIRNMRFLIKISTIKFLEISGQLGFLKMFKDRKVQNEGLIISMRGGILVPFEIVANKKLVGHIFHMLKAAYKVGSHIQLAYGGNIGTRREYAPLILNIRKKYKLLFSYESDTGFINLIHIGPDSWAIAFFK